MEHQPVSSDSSTVAELFQWACAAELSKPLTVNSLACRQEMNQQSSGHRYLPVLIHGWRHREPRGEHHEPPAFLQLLVAVLLLSHPDPVRCQVMSAPIDLAPQTFGRNLGSELGSNLPLLCGQILVKRCSIDTWLQRAGSPRGCRQVRASKNGAARHNAGGFGNRRLRAAVQVLGISFE